MAAMPAGSGVRCAAAGAASAAVSTAARIVEQVPAAVRLPAGGPDLMTGFMTGLMGEGFAVRESLLRRLRRGVAAPDGPAAAILVAGDRRHPISLNLRSAPR